MGMMADLFLRCPSNHREDYFWLQLLHIFVDWSGRQCLLLVAGISGSLQSCKQSCWLVVTINNSTHTFACICKKLQLPVFAFSYSKNFKAIISVFLIKTPMFLNEISNKSTGTVYLLGPGVAVMIMRRPGYIPPGINLMFDCSMKIYTITISYNHMDHHRHHLVPFCDHVYYKYMLQSI